MPRKYEVFKNEIIRNLFQLHDLSAMRDGLPLQPWNQPDIVPLGMATLVLLGVWLLRAGFSREALRLQWAWSRPRNLTTRNASETPRTMGVVLSHCLAMLGMIAGWSLALKHGVSRNPWFAIPVWILSSLAIRLVAGRLLTKNRDLASSWLEITRHNHSWLGILMSLWCVVMAIHPISRHDYVVAWGSAVVVCLALLYGAGRTTQLLLSGRQQRVVGILYLCTLEWSWSLFWTFWSIRFAIRGH